MSARNPRFTLAKRHLPRLAITAIGLVLSFPQAWAVGFGSLRVQSYLGQPLRAEVEIIGVSAEEARNLVVKLSAPETYQQAGVPYSSLLSTMRSTLEPRGNGQYVVKLSSSQPANEPFVDVLLDMSWASGKSSRAYTVLLDPADQSRKSSSMPAPVMAPGAAPESLTPTLVAKPAGAPPSPADSSQSVGWRLRPTPAAVTPSSTPAKPSVTSKTATKPNADATRRYRVEEGDTLSTIAEDYAVDNQVSLDQMLLAMYRANPSAFIGGNINRLKSGAVLTVPDAAQAQQVSEKAARREISAQTQGFSNYRERLANHAASAKPSVSSTAKQQDTGRVTAKVEDKAAPSTTPKDQLKLTKPDANKATPAGNAKEEARIAQERASKDAQAKAAQVAKNNTDLKKLAELKAAIPGAVSVATKPVAASDATTLPQTAVTSPATAATVEASAAASAPLINPIAAEKPSFLSELLDNPLTLPGAGFLAVLGGIYVLVRNRRKRQEQEDNPIERSLGSQENTVMGNHPATETLFVTTGELTPADIENHVPPPPPAAQAVFDSLDLNLGAPAEPRITPAPHTAATDQSPPKDMKTKLDLAMAYVDLGDRNSARELLKEVVEYDDGALRERAKHILSELG